jgi:hypothetical protein
VPRTLWSTPALRVLVVAAALVAPSCGAGSSGSGGAGSTSTTAAPTTTLVPPGILTPIDQVLPGQCFDQLPDEAQRPFAVLAIPCEQPHHFEIFDRFDYRDPSGKAVPHWRSYPGTTTVRKAAEQGCFERFEPWMGIDWTRSDFDIQSWWPSAASWTKADRTVTCAVFRFTGAATRGSVRGAKE